MTDTRPAAIDAADKADCLWQVQVKGSKVMPSALCLVAKTAIVE